MFLSAALSAASKKATVASSPPQVDLDLSSASRPCLVAFEDDATESVSAPPDPSASAAPLSQDDLPPSSTLPPPQEAFRRDLPSMIFLSKKDLFFR